MSLDCRYLHYQKLVMKPLLLSVMVWLICGSTSVNGQESLYVHVEVTMEAHGFMCPFLTPMFLGFLEDRGAEWIVHDLDASTVEFAFPLDSLQTARDFTDRLVLIGYEEKQVGYARFDTTGTLPNPPAP